MRQRLADHRHSASAPQRPHPQPRRDGQGLCLPRVRHLRGRAAVASAATPEAKMEASGQLTRALRGLLAVAEAYPELKANANFQQLQADLTDTENRISYARQSYNDVVMDYNNAIQTFPGSLVAGGPSRASLPTPTRARPRRSASSRTTPQARQIESAEKRTGTSKQSLELVPVLYIPPKPPGTQRSRGSESPGRPKGWGGRGPAGAPRPA